MRKYLSTIHTRPDSHKKRFALAVSAAFTFLIFGIWAVASFGHGGLVAQSSDIESQRAHPDISPMQSLQDELGASFSSIKSSFGSLENYGQ